MNEERRAILLKIWERHIETEFAEKSAEAAVDTMVPHATVNHVPTMTGACAGALGPQRGRWGRETAGPFAPPHAPYTMEPTPQ